MKASTYRFYCNMNLLMISKLKILFNPPILIFYVHNASNENSFIYDP